MYAVDLEQHRAELESVAAAHATHPVQLVIVESVGAWTQAEGVKGARGDPQATALADGDNWAVVMRRTIDVDSVESTLCLMELRGFERCREVLRSPAEYAKHLMLHEIAHLANNWDQKRERDCDQWAFERIASAI